MFSLIENIKEDKKDFSPIGMSNVLQELNISYSTLYRWCKYKGFPHYRVQGSNKKLFNREKILEWLENQPPRKHPSLDLNQKPTP
jgi:excisionase family DNA binding protein|tara:strand:- start:347 stop:601 length:255 start_codon:yes stop_codon:yes gene_type:complete